MFLRKISGAVNVQGAWRIRTNAEIQEICGDVYKRQRLLNVLFVLMKMGRGSNLQASFIPSLKLVSSPHTPGPAPSYATA